MATQQEIDATNLAHYEHVKAVNRNLTIFVKDLIDRGLKHDESKFHEPELSIFAENTTKLSSVEFMSEGYIAALESIKPALEHHYSHNSHHPQYYENGIDGMDLGDLVEMVCDWAASIKRMKDGNLDKSLDLNTDRFNICPQLKSILKNTIEMYL